MQRDDSWKRENDDLFFSIFQQFCLNVDIQIYLHSENKIKPVSGTTRYSNKTSFNISISLDKKQPSDGVFIYTTCMIMIIKRSDSFSCE